LNFLFCPKKFGFYKPNVFFLEIQLWFLRTEFFIKGKIGFLGGIKEMWGVGREIFLEGGGT
jgi:hypothetical protein